MAGGYAVEWTVEAYRERSGLELLPQHQAQLRASAIHLEVAAERGYRSATTKADLQRLGFAQSQQRPPALVVPLWSVDGEVELHQIRPDEPRRAKDGKAVKYETPEKAGLRLDVHPRMRTFLGDPERPLFITEGVKKVDAATSADLCCLGLLGVSGWRGRNRDGGLTVLADWEHVALKGRPIYLVFDSDVMTKTQVYLQLGRLRTWLERRGSEALVVYLPSADGGTKTGLDDFLAAGNTRDDLLALATNRFRHPDSTDSGAPTWDLGDYHLDARQGTFRRSQDDDGVRKLADFVAYIERKDIEDDGEGAQAEGPELLERLRYHLVIQQGDRMARHTVTAAAFHAMRWPPEVTSLDLIVAGGTSVRDYLREAIELASGEIARQRHPEGGGVIPRHTVYVHTGWRSVGGRYVYLHAGGAIGEEGVVSGVEVRLAPQLARLVLPVPPEGEELIEAVRTSVRLLELGPDQLMVPVLGAIYRSVLAPADFSVHCHGDSGRFKSEVMALAHSHFGGPFDSRELLSWTSTGNSLEGLLHETACMAAVVDDFLPGGLTARERERMLDAAQRVFRAQGNRQGRSRMRADASIRPAKEPRGLLLSTGEEVPPGLSQLARIWLVEQGKDAVSEDRLTAAQDAAGLLAGATAGFVRWLAPGMKAMRQQLRSELKELRGGYQAAHRRTSEIAASLEIGWRRFLVFALEQGAITDPERAELAGRVRAALLGGAALQARHQQEANPVQRYISGLAGALAAGVVHLSTLYDKVPEAPGAWGWRPRPGLSEIDGEGNRQPVWEPRGERVGWIDGDSLYLLPEMAYKAAATQHRDGLGIAEIDLRRRLHDAGFLVSVGGDKRHPLMVRTPRAMAATRPWVLRLRASFSAGPAGPAGPGGSGESDDPLTNSSEPSEGGEAGPAAAGESGTERDHPGSPGPAWSRSGEKSGTNPEPQSGPASNSECGSEGHLRGPGPAGPAGPAVFGPAEMSPRDEGGDDDEVPF
jgi:Domain of unknown function (DUF3854)